MRMDDGVAVGSYKPESRNFWNVATQAEIEEARQKLSLVVEQHVDELVGVFYDHFLADPEASDFLSHSVVQERLSGSLRNWLRELIRTDPRKVSPDFVARQVQIGAVHARIRIPVRLVLEGAGLLKSNIAIRLRAQEEDREATINAILMLDELMDYSMRLMSEAYFTDIKQHTRTDEAFRLFSLGQDINLERETQRSALLEWSQGALFAMLGKNSRAQAPLAASEFGLWVRHRGAVLFQGAPALTTIEQVIAHIDQNILPRIAWSDSSIIGELQERIEEIKYLLAELFQTALNVENGREPLTRALTRRFLPSVLSREITLANQGETALSVLMIDIDQFKLINDRHGHSTGDAALSRIAELVLGMVRSSDFVFRYGGEEFLVVLVETDERQASAIAEQIRREVAKRPFKVPGQDPLSLTVSVGVACYDGHPSHEYLINAADKALYSAKKAGRNRVVVAQM